MHSRSENFNLTLTLNEPLHLPMIDTTGILLVQAVACAVLSAIVASNKNRNVAGWGALGFFFGVLGFIAAIAVSEVDPEEEQSAKKRQASGSEKFNPDEHEKKCPTCAEYIKLEALVCRYCGHEFSDKEIDKQIEERREEVKAQSNEDSPESQEEEVDTKKRYAIAFAVFFVLMIVSLLIGVLSNA